MSRRWLRVVLVTVVIGAGALVDAGDLGAQAEDAFSGRILDLRTGLPIAGVTVRLGDTSGALLSGLTATSGPDGRFVLTGATAEEYHVRVDGSAVDYSPGWVGSGTVPRGRFLVDTIPEAVTWAPRDLGDIVVFPAFFSGRLLDATTGAPVAGVALRAREDSSGRLVTGATTTSGPDGRFLLRGTPVTRATPSYHVEVIGAAVGYEDGQVGVLPAHPLGRPVGPHRDAVSLGPGDLGDIVLDPPGPPPPPDVWGFNYLSHTAAPPGTEIRGALMRQISHDTPEADGDRSRLVPIRVADQMCNNTVAMKTVSMLDSSGRVLVVSPAVEGLVPRVPIVVPDGTAPGTYYLRIQSAYGTEVSDFGVAPPRGAGLDLTDPAYHMPVGVHRVSECVRFQVTAAGTSPGAAFDIGPPHGEVLTASSPPLRRDSCPVSLWSVVGRVPSAFGIGLNNFVELVVGRVGLPPLPPTPPVTTTVTTPTTTPTTTPGTTPTTPTTQPAPVDTTPPTLGALTFTGCNQVTQALDAQFQINATDNVGVVSVTYTWTYSGGNGSAGSGAMTGGPTYNGTVVVPGPSGGTVEVTVTARDAAGNASAPAIQKTMTVC